MSIALGRLVGPYVVAKPGSPRARAGRLGRGRSWLVLVLLACTAGCAIDTGTLDTSSPHEDTCAQCDRRTREPQRLDPELDRALLREIGLPSHIDDRLDRVNLLLIGQDGRGGPGKNDRTSDGRPALASRGDSITVMSVDRASGQIALFALYRGNRPFDACGTGVWGPSVPDTERYFANLYRDGGRRAFVPCISEMMTARLANDAELGRHLDAHGRFPIHALVEADFSSLKALVGSPLDLASRIGVLIVAKWTFTYASHWEQLLGAARRRDEILRALRDRDSDASGYQRAFNQAKFIATALGYAAYGQHHRESLLEEATPLIEILGASLPPSELTQIFRREDDSPLLPSSCYAESASPVAIYALGGQWGGSDFLRVQNGTIEDKARTNLLHSVDPTIDILAAPLDCD